MASNLKEAMTGERKKRNLKKVQRTFSGPIPTRVDEEVTEFMNEPSTIRVHGTHNTTTYLHGDTIIFTTRVYATIDMDEVLR